MKISEILELTKGRELPLAREDETIKEVLKKIIAYPHTRLIYVVDKDDRCKGMISLGTLIRHVFPHYFEPAIHPRSLIHMITSETAKDIMNKGVIVATQEDNVEEVIERMIKAKIKEIAIVDDEQRVVADLTMLDLLKYYHLMDSE